MLSHTELKKGTLFVMDNQPYMVVDFDLMFKGRGSSTSQIKAKNLMTGNITSRTFHTGDLVEEAEITKRDLKFLYEHKGQYFFSELEGPAKRFFLTQEQIGPQAKFLKQNTSVKGVVFDDKIINIEMPVKVCLKVIEAPPGVKGDRSEAGTKQVILETKAAITTPLFINEGDVIEINTQTEEYVRRIV